MDERRRCTIVPIGAYLIVFAGIGIRRFPAARSRPAMALPSHSMAVLCRWSLAVRLASFLKTLGQGALKDSGFSAQESYSR